MATYGTFVDDVSLRASEANDFFAKLTNTTGATQGVTPTQSGSTLYFVVNKLVYGFGRRNFQTAGTAGSAIEITLPVTASSGSFRVIGAGQFIDSINDLRYRLAVVKTSTTKAQFLSETGTSLTNRFGNNPGVTIQAGSFGAVLLFSFCYEAA